MMKALIQYWDVRQHDLAREALRKVGRKDLIGRGQHCLVPAEWQSSVPSANPSTSAAHKPGPRRAPRGRR
jgi:hypothetical protein